MFLVVLCAALALLALYLVVSAIVEFPQDVDTFKRGK